MNVNPNQLKEKIEQLLLEGKMKEAIAELLPLANESIYNELILLQIKHKQIKEQSNLNLTNGEAMNQDYMNLQDSVWKILNTIFDKKMEEIEKKEPIEPTSVKVEETKKEAPIWKKLSRIALIVGLITGVVRVLDMAKDRIFGSNVAIDTTTVTILVKGQNEIPLPPKGKVYLTYGNAHIGKEINNSNEAIFTEVPSGYFEGGNKVSITFEDPNNEPYRAVFEDSLYQLVHNEHIELLVSLKGLDKLYGIVKDAKSGDYVEGARVSVLNLETFSDKNGWWELEIKESDKQRKFHTIRSSKEGYKNWEISNIPAQTDKEISILLKPK